MLKNFILVYLGKNYLSDSNCLANLNNIPRRPNRGKIELLLYRDFHKCGTEGLDHNHYDDCDEFSVRLPLQSK